MYDDDAIKKLKKVTKVMKFAVKREKGLLAKTQQRDWDWEWKFGFVVLRL